jgi:hypothetical protein
VSIDLSSWTPRCSPEIQQKATSALESGAILLLPRLGFVLSESEERFLSPVWSDGRSKNVSFKGRTAKLRGAAGKSEDLSALMVMIQRFALQATALVESLVPTYQSHLDVARTSFRPSKVEGRKTSLRQDDTLLHVDAFPSRPTRGARILRIFSNVNPHGEPRVWRVGEPFEAFARRFLTRVGRSVPGMATLLSALRITKGKRSEYDFTMLRLHDLAKQDESYQRNAPQLTIPFPPHCTWLAYSDQVLHAAMGGQYMLEQTIHLSLCAMQDESRSPLRVLERRTGRNLLE